MKKGLILVLLISLALMSCKPTPKAIEYGVDGCHFCKMTIVDKVHAAEVVTQKGKVYKFDATECMINFMKDFDADIIKLYLSNDFNQPEALIDATKATFLISENIPSPMGAFLSAFKTSDEALSIQKDQGGDIFTWEELIQHLN